MTTDLSDQQLLRYARQIMLPEIDVEGQQKLLASKVLLLGAGGLGCVVAQYLVSCGIGELTLVDDDRVEWSNLQRQILFDASSINELKCVAARERLQQLNNEVDIKIITRRLSGDELDAAVRSVDLVIDGTDSFASRFEHNRACVGQRRTLISGAVIRFEGQVTVFGLAAPSSPCYQCVFPRMDETDNTCAENGVLGPVVGTVGSLMATEAIKVLLALPGILDSRLLLFDALHVQWREVHLKKDPKCPSCQSGNA